MFDKIIINEYMNHFFTPIQLSVFLDIPVDTILTALSNEELIISVLGKNGLDKLSIHKDRIDRWIYSSSVKPYNISKNEDNLVVDIANYIISTGSSIRNTASHFGLGKSTVHDYIEEKLPSISIILYKNVFDVLMSNKSIKISGSFANYDIVYYEYELLMAGYSLNDIARILGFSFQKVQRDLGNRLSSVDETMAKKSKEKLKEHRLLPLLENQFKSQ